MAGLLSLSEQSEAGDRGRLTRSPVTTAVVPASHLDVIPGLHLARRLAMLFRSNHEVYNHTQICPDAPLDEEYLVLRYCT